MSLAKQSINTDWNKTIDILLLKILLVKDCETHLHDLLLHLQLANIYTRDAGTLHSCPWKYAAKAGKFVDRSITRDFLKQPDLPPLRFVHLVVPRNKLRVFENWERRFFTCGQNPTLHSTCMLNAKSLMARYGMSHSTHYRLVSGSLNLSLMCETYLRSRSIR